MKKIKLKHFLWELGDVNEIIGPPAKMDMKDMSRFTSISGDLHAERGLRARIARAGEQGKTGIQGQLTDYASHKTMPINGAS